MQFTWIPAATPKVLTPAADFRVKTVSRAIAHDLRVEENEIWWLVLVEPLGSVALDDLLANAAGELGVGDDPSLYLALPTEYTPGERTLPGPGISTLYATRDYINAANQFPDKAGISWMEVGPAFRREDIRTPGEGMPAESAASKKVKVPPGSVVVAVIDNGIAVGHDLFRRTDEQGNPETRVEFFWNMDGNGDGDEFTTIGNRWVKSGLDAALLANIQNGLLDDAGFYRQIGATDWAKRRHTPIAHRLSHGTHVMGLCAGNNPDGTTGRNRPIIAVSLRTMDVLDPSGQLFITWLEQALKYIEDRHKLFEYTQGGGRPPLVINFSFGNYAGPHDGTGSVEEKIIAALDKLRKGPGRAQFVLPAGNGNESRCHARIGLDPAQPGATLDWRLQPGDRSASSVQIWLDQTGHVDDDLVTLTVQGPGDLQPVSVNCDPAAPAQDLRDANNVRIGTVYFLAAPDADHRHRFGVHLFATGSSGDIGPFTPPGIWKLQFRSGDGKSAGLKAWILRDETLPGFPVFGRQSYFDEPSYVRFYEPGVPINPRDLRLIGAELGYDPVGTTSPVRRCGTLSGFTGSELTVVVGGFVDSTSRMALYSATGPTNNPDRDGPDASARSDTSIALRGVLSAGSASGSMLSMPGTSVSAPRVARWIAERLSANDPAGPAAVRATAEWMDPSSKLKPPPIRSGGGRMLNLADTYGRRRWPGQT